MDLKQRRIKVLEQMLDNAITEQVGFEIGIETKETMLLRMGANPMAQKVEAALQQEKAMLAMQPAVIEILQRKLAEAQQ